jgi:hypothetical protein
MWVHPSPYAHKTTALLCILLLLHLQLGTAGCGQSLTMPLPAPPVGAPTVIPLTPDHPISVALRNTAFAGATAMEVNRDVGTFRMIFPDDGRLLSGHFVQRGAEWEITQFDFASGDKSATMFLNPSTRQVTAIRTVEGDEWKPSNTNSALAINQLSATSRLGSYFEANAELMQLEADLVGKSDAAFFLPIFTTILIIWLICANFFGICTGLPIIFAAITAILISMPPPENPEPEPTPGVNNPPVARDDAFTTSEDTPVNGDVLADNGSGVDSDPDGDALSVALATGPANGSVVLQIDGSFSYTPDMGFSGMDTFVYQLADGNGGTDLATATITVTPVNEPPDAMDDEFTVEIEFAVSGNLFLDNGHGPDTDPDGDTFVVCEVEGAASNVGMTINFPSGASVIVMANGDFTYDSIGGVALVQGKSDTFTYTICDGNGGSDTATVTVTVTFGNPE